MVIRGFQGDVGILLGGGVDFRQYGSNSFRTHDRILLGDVDLRRHRSDSLSMGKMESYVAMSSRAETGVILPVMGICSDAAVNGACKRRVTEI